MPEPTRSPFSYAIIRVVPRIERGERFNAGVVVFCRQRDFLGLRTYLDPVRLRALAPEVDAAQLEAQLVGLTHAAVGDPRSGAIAALPASERFGWLVAPSSTMIQPSEVHTGLCEDPEATLDALFAELVSPVDAPASPTMSRVEPIPIADTRPLRHAVLRPHQSIDAIVEHELPDAFAVGAFDSDDRLIAVGFVSPDGGPDDWRVRGMATEPASRGRGAGSAVLEALVAYARGRGAGRVWCHARVAARALYERAGFRVTSEEFEVPDIGPHYVMELTLS